MSDFSGEHGFIPEWLPPALLLFCGPSAALVGLFGGSWGTLAVVLVVEVAVLGLGLVGWLLWPRVQGWRTDRVLRREETAGLVLVPAVADKAGNESNQITPAQED